MSSLVTFKRRPAKVLTWLLVLLVLLVLIAATVAVVFWWLGKPAPRKVCVERAKAELRTVERRKDIDDVIKPGLRQAVTVENHKAWSKVLWTMKWTNYREDDGIEPLRAMLRQTSWPEESRRLVLETSYALHPGAFVPEMQLLAGIEQDPRRWAMAAAYLRRATTHPIGVPDTATENFRTDPRVLASVAEDREPRAAVAQKTPPLADLLTWDFAGRPVVFSFQRANRDFPGRVALRRAAGAWLTNSDGSLWTLPQFARSVSNLPGTITNGNTPAGILGIRELAFTQNAAIGPTMAITLALPGEYEKWTHEQYQNLLPPSWRSHWPMQEAWWAGQVGRYEIMAHGTTIDPEWWRSSPFYPLTPSHGCLTCDEEWSPETGERLRSDQQELVDAVILAGGAPAWLVVVETESSGRSAVAVSHEEVAGFVADAKR
jgi:hypothetical protein